jgi:hypothetical protein
MSGYNLDDSPENWTLFPRRLSPNFTLSNGDTKAYPIRLEHYKPGYGQSPEILDLDLIGLRRLIEVLETAGDQISTGDMPVYTASSATRRAQSSPSEPMYRLTDVLPVMVRSSRESDKTWPEAIELEIAIDCRTVITFEAWETAGLLGGLDAYRTEACEIEEAEDVRRAQELAKEWKEFASNIKARP